MGVESHGEHRSGVYQELARGFGAADYTDLFASTKANETRLMSASELKRRQRGEFGTTLGRHALIDFFSLIGRRGLAEAFEEYGGLDQVRTRTSRGAYKMRFQLELGEDRERRIQRVNSCWQVGQWRLRQEW